MPSTLEITAYLANLLDIDKQNDYCPNGLQVAGKPTIKHIVTGVTACYALIEQAVANHADLLLVHHGYFWKNESACITAMKKKRIGLLLQHDLNLAAYHLPLDQHSTLGNNITLLQHLDLAGTIAPAPFSPIENLIWQLTLSKPMAIDQLQQIIQQKLARPAQLVGNGAAEIKQIVLCTGAAQSYAELAFHQGADVYLTGEISEPCFHTACEYGRWFMACGHHATERYGIQALGNHLAKEFDMTHQFIDINNPI